MKAKPMLKVIRPESIKLRNGRTVPAGEVIGFGVVMEYGGWHPVFLVVLKDGGTHPVAFKDNTPAAAKWLSWLHQFAEGPYPSRDCRVVDRWVRTVPLERLTTHAMQYGEYVIRPHQKEWRGVTYAIEDSKAYTARVAANARERQFLGDVNVREVCRQNGIAYDEFVAGKVNLDRVFMGLT